jgi:hypothetical protein
MGYGLLGVWVMASLAVSSALAGQDKLDVGKHVENMGSCQIAVLVL